MTRPGLIITAGVLALLAPSVTFAETPKASALAHNAAYEAATKSGLSPQTLSEMLTCAAMWDRWDYAVTSAAEPKFAGALRRELTSANAKKRKIYWQRLARREMNEDDDAAYFEKTRSRAEESADKLYAAYAANDARGTRSFIEWLGICK